MKNFNVNWIILGAYVLVSNLLNLEHPVLFAVLTLWKIGMLYIAGVYIVNPIFGLWSELVGNLYYLTFSLLNPKQKMEMPDLVDDNKHIVELVQALIFILAVIIA